MDPSETPPPRPGEPGWEEWQAAEEMQAKVREVARRMAERIRKTMEDTGTHPPAPADPPDEPPKS